MGKRVLRCAGAGSIYSGDLGRDEWGSKVKVLKRRVEVRKSAGEEEPR